MASAKQAKTIDSVLKLLEAKNISEPAADLAITGVSYDSRAVTAGHAFCCIPGEHVDGNEFVGQAIKNGASCIFSEREQAGISVPYFVVKDVRLALALLADHFYDYPSLKLRPLGVTGTNGKTTITHIVEHILTHAGHKIGLIGTLGARWPGKSEYQNTKFTTPQSSDLHRILASMVEAGCSHVAMEVSSHALVQKRVGGCHFASACLTNITQDHLDFHQTMDHYWRSKRILFESMNQTSHDGKSAVVNIDDALAGEFLKVIGPSVRKITYGWSDNADIYVKSAQFDFSGTKLVIATPLGDMTTNIRLTGHFNVYNVMAAMAMAMAEGVSLQVIAEALTDFGGVSGRFEVVTGESADEPLCVVDYAHTPDGLDNVLKAARAMVPKDGQLIVVFGCGGDRDPSKRPQMGEIAEKSADVVVITSDNPRSEDPQKIIANILAGVKRMSSVKVEADRSRAIRLAIGRAGNLDVVVIAGKGHENYQILADKTIPFDDRTEVKLALAERGINRPEVSHK